MRRGKMTIPFTGKMTEAQARGKYVVHMPAPWSKGLSARELRLRIAPLRKITAKMLFVADRFRPTLDKEAHAFKVFDSEAEAVVWVEKVRDNYGVNYAEDELRDALGKVVDAEIRLGELRRKILEEAGFEGLPERWRVEE